MSDYTSMANAIWSIMEKKAQNNKAPDGGPETDMNDQIAVGSYQSKSFEMSADAQKLYSNLPKDTNPSSAEQAAIHLDKIFGLDKATTVRKHASPQDLETAKQHAEKIMAMAKDMGQEDAHSKILKTHLDNISSRVGVDHSAHLSPGDEKHPADDPRFKTSSKDYTTDLVNDRDIDNVKKFIINRNKAAQIKHNIIDD